MSPRSGWNLPGPLGIDSVGMHWEKRLAYTITPKSGPMRSMETLLDANRALSTDLPRGYLRHRKWLDTGKLLVEAAEIGSDQIIHEATEQLLSAIEDEGWMTRRSNAAG